MSSAHTSPAYCKHIQNILSQYLYYFPSAEHTQNFYNIPSHVVLISQIGNCWGNLKVPKESYHDVLGQIVQKDPK